MNCRNTQSWMAEYTDGTLEAGRRAGAEAHLSVCAECAHLAGEMAETRRMLRGLAPAQTSAQFDARLAARLAARQARGGWWSRLFTAPAPRLLRPALALGAAAFAVAGTALLHTPVPSPPPAPSNEAALITQCVALHQRDVAAQPLTDSAATGIGHSGWTGDVASDNAQQDSL